ncbi:aminotransferase class I/II-fold pyridoxal phosphate-dependent enzyme [Limosilactobacillus fermentum]|uniref:aminotransferase class I/II-fold pyridoxal phosphate-dependent enzyme n=1 Tax=Limosilactobacillus fermentum TaxID=1613 RepID=UPI003EC0C0C4
MSDKTKLIVLNNPDNPTGALMSQAGLQTIVDIAKSVDTYVLCDEVYRHLTQEDGYSPSIIDLYDKGISTSSFSKVFSLAGIRLGWLATHDQAVMKACLSYRDYETISCGQLDEMVDPSPEIPSSAPRAEPGDCPGELKGLRGMGSPTTTHHLVKA